jgi:hypothetical protein
MDPCARRCKEAALRSDPAYIAREEVAFKRRAKILKEEVARMEGSRFAREAEPFDHGEVLLGAMQREGATLGL